MKTNPQDSAKDKGGNADIVAQPLHAQDDDEELDNKVEEKESKGLDIALSGAQSTLV